LLINHKNNNNNNNNDHNTNDDDTNTNDEDNDNNEFLDDWRQERGENVGQIHIYIPTRRQTG